MTEHSINRSGSASDTDEQDAVDGQDDADSDRSEAEIKRDLRKSTVGQAILDYDRQLRL